MSDHKEGFVGVDQIPKTKLARSLPRVMQDMSDVVADVLDGGDLNIVNILEVVPRVMETLRKYKKLSGKKKKELVVEIINEVIEVQIENEIVEDALQLFVSTALPKLIDVAVDISKKRYKFKKSWASCC